MRLRFLGDGELTEDGVGEPCVVFGLTFPVGEWVTVTDAPAKLLSNPLFEVEARPRPVARTGHKGLAHGH